jgi:hypothetical protein
MEKRELNIEVGDLIGLPSSTKIAATVFIPDAAHLHRPTIVMFASPGGGMAVAILICPRFMANPTAKLNTMRPRVLYSSHMTIWASVTAHAPITRNSQMTSSPPQTMRRFG